VKKQWFSYLFCSDKYHKIANYFIFELVKKKFLGNLQRITELFTQKIVIMLSKILVRNPEKTYSGSRNRGQKGNRIPDPDPQHYSNTIKRISVPSIHVKLSDWIILLLGFPDTMAREN
jgi:hypothetical protein